LQTHQIWPTKKIVVIRKNIAIGCAIRFDFDENGNIIYGTPFAYPSKWFIYLTVIPFMVFYVMCDAFMLHRGQSIGLFGLIIGFVIIRILVSSIAKFPSGKLVKRLGLMMKSQYEPGIT